MKIQTVQFERTSDTSYWRFVAETDEPMPHGDKSFGGSLLHMDKGWKARAHVATKWGEMAKSREQAVQNCFADAIRISAECEATRLRRDAEVEQLRQRVAGRSEWLRRANINLPQTGEPSIYRSLLRLSQDDVKGYVGLMVEVFKRGS